MMIHREFLILDDKIYPIPERYCFEGVSEESKSLLRGRCAFLMLHAGI
jgi:hypothetical protein